MYWLWLTSDVIFGTVQHVSSVNELITGASNSQLRLRVAQNDFTPENITGVKMNEL